MLDIRLIREDGESVRQAMAARGADIDLEAVMAADTKRRELLAVLEAKRAERNSASEAIGRIMRQVAQAKKAGEPVADLLAAAEEAKVSPARLGEEIATLEGEVRPVEEKLRSLLLEIPNLPHSSVPRGRDETDNQVVRVWGERPAFDFQPRAHWELAEDLDIIDFDRAAKIAGARFALYKGVGARLERALINFMLDTHTDINGYTEVLPPVLVNEASLTGTGQLPKFADDLFKCADDDLWLIPTAEVPVTNIHRDEIIDQGGLPFKYAAYTPCFRREAGAHGRETRGLIRQHQFNKVELVKFVEPESSYDELESLTAEAEGILQALGLHYRVIALSTGDLGFSAAKTYDLEVWLPSYQDFKEISSCSNFEDFQARRANIRYRDQSDKPRFVHTLNGSGLAIGRTVAAIMENCQQPDGSITIPEALLDYLGVESISLKKRR